MTQYTHEQRAAIHIARAEKAQARADIKKGRERMRLASVYSKASALLRLAIGQTDVADVGPLDAAQEKLKALYERAISE